MGDRVWLDENKDGLQTPADTENVGGVTVTLYSDQFARIIDTQVTDSNGHYLFTGLAAGRYCLAFESACRYPCDVG